MEAVLSRQFCRRRFRFELLLLGSSPGNLQLPARFMPYKPLETIKCDHKSAGI